MEKHFDNNVRYAMIYRFIYRLADEKKPRINLCGALSVEINCVKETQICPSGTKLRPADYSRHR